MDENILSPEERWKVIYHIKSMSLGDAFQIATSDVVEEAPAEVEEEEKVTQQYEIDLLDCYYLGHFKGFL